MLATVAVFLARGYHQANKELGHGTACKDLHLQTLLLHGTDDTDVPYAQSVIMAEAFKKAGVAHELVTIEGGGHSFDGKVKAEHLTSGETTPELATLYKALQWFGKYV